MAKKSEQASFLQRAIEGLTQDGFDEVVRIFQKYYLKHEIINVNGPNDGGCDIKIFHNKRETKKCVQVTVRKDWEKKLKTELPNVNELISKYNYSEKYDFFCTSVVSQVKIEEMKQYALKEYDIELTIYEARSLSQLYCPELQSYLYALHDDIVLKPQQPSIDKTKKTLYDFLTVGKGTTDIKNDLLNSFIIAILYEKESMSIVSLKNELELRINKKISDITHTINLLKSARRIIKDPDDAEKLRLSESEFATAKDIFAYASLVEQEFIYNFKELLSKYSILNECDLLEQLKSLYRTYYKNDIDEQFNNTLGKNEDIFKSFETYLNSVIPNEQQRNLFIIDLKKLCENNTYLNRISASESFLSLYTSDRLEQYVTHSKKNIFVDTPVLVYLLCATFQIDNIYDWGDSLYRSVKSLYNLHTSNSDKIHFNIMQDYIGEVAGELKKAFQISKLENAPFFSNLGSTRNSFYNYYRHLKDGDFMEEENTIDCFDDFINSFGIDETMFNDDNSISIIRRLSELIEDMDINIVSCPFMEDFNNAKIEYEKLLFDNQKTESAVSHDVKQILYLFKDENLENGMFITWDVSLSKLRDKLKKLNNYGYFPIYNPAKFSNKIALEVFNIDSSAITNDIFIYADKTFGISTKVKSLLEIIAPIYDANGSKNNKVLKALGKIREQQIDSMEYNETDINNQNLPIEEVLIKMLEIVYEKEKKEHNKNIMKKFKSFMMNQYNEKYIVEIINQGSKDFTSKKEINLSNFFERVSKVEL